MYNTERDSVDSMTAVDEYFRNYESDFLDSGRKKFRRKLEFVEGYALVYRVAAGKYQQRIVDLKRKLEALECNGYNTDYKSFYLKKIEELKNAFIAREKKLINLQVGKIRQLKDTIAQKEVTIRMDSVE